MQLKITVEVTAELDLDDDEDANGRVDGNTLQICIDETVRTGYIIFERMRLLGKRGVFCWMEAKFQYKRGLGSGRKMIGQIRG